VKLLLASHNANKLRELRAALPTWDIALLDASDEPVEDGDTFAANARIKARHGRAHAPADAWVAGEDSGVEVDALDGRPGVHSARWAEDGVSRLLTELGDSDDRRAR
jgi:XTP/dITP diphosphohydrolase